MLLLFAITFTMLVLVCCQDGHGRALARIAVGTLCLLFGGTAAGLLANGFAGQCAAAAETDEVEPSRSASSASAVRAAEVTDETEMLPAAEATLDADGKSSRPAPTMEKPPVEIVTAVKYLTPRPDWVETRPNVSGPTHTFPVESGLYYRKREADLALVAELQKCLDDYVDDHLGASYASKLVRGKIQPVPSGDRRAFQLALDGDVLPLDVETFDEQVQVSFGVMHQSHALLKVDQAVRDRLDQRWSELKATSRLLQTALGAGAVLLLLGTLVGYVKLDTATRGFYTRRLQFGAAATILSLIAASVLVARWIPWM